jgi:hypothetical protein
MKKEILFTLVGITLMTGVNANEVTLAGKREAVKTVGTSAITLEIAPGPVTKELVVNFSEASSNSALTITDLKGVKVLSIAVEPGASKASINVSKLSSGTYFLVFNSGEARASKLFVKQ